VPLNMMLCILLIPSGSVTPCKMPHSKHAHHTNISAWDGNLPVVSNTALNQTLALSSPEICRQQAREGLQSLMFHTLYSWKSLCPVSHWSLKLKVLSRRCPRPHC
jgi:hypothetical protein